MTCQPSFEAGAFHRRLLALLALQSCQNILSIGQMKVAELGRLGDPVALAMMRQIKTALDPQGLLNPGKLVPPIG